MFYSNEILGRKGPLGLLWCACFGTWGRLQWWGEGAGQAPRAFECGTACACHAARQASPLAPSTPAQDACAQEDNLQAPDSRHRHPRPLVRWQGLACVVVPWRQARPAHAGAPTPTWSNSALLGGTCLQQTAMEAARSCSPCAYTVTLALPAPYAVHAARASLSPTCPSRCACKAS